MAYLYDPHGQAGLLRELFPYVSGGLRRLRESRLQDLQLLGLDCGTRTPPLWPRVAVVRGLVLRLRIPRLRVSVQRPCKIIFYKKRHTFTKQILVGVRLTNSKVIDGQLKLLVRHEFLQISVCWEMTPYSSLDSSILLDLREQILLWQRSYGPSSIGYPSGECKLVLSLHLWLSSGCCLFVRLFVYKTHGVTFGPNLTTYITTGNNIFNSYAQETITFQLNTSLTRMHQFRSYASNFPLWRKCQVKAVLVSRQQYWHFVWTH